MTKSIRIPIWRKALNLAGSAFTHLFQFLGFLLMELYHFKWYHWTVIALPFVRVYTLPFGDQIVPPFASVGYTYQSLWYYTWSRILELVLYYTISKQCKSLLFLMAAILCIGKVMDEAVFPFGWYIGEAVYWLVAGVIVFKVWYTEHRER